MASSLPTSFLVVFTLKILSFPSSIISLFTKFTNCSLSKTLRSFWNCTKVI